MIFTTLLLLSVIVVLTIIARDENNKLRQLQQPAEDLIRFPAPPFRFEPPPDEINLENEHDCMGELKCDTEDPFSCAGCKSLLASCVHFDDDQTVILYDQTKVTLPKNKSPTEGYCLQIKKIAEACSPQGELCLVAPDANSFNFMLMCICKNPGLIGNDQIFGDCTDVRICNGTIDDINKPIDQMNCICPDGKIPSRSETGIPICIDKTVMDSAAGELESALRQTYKNVISTADFFDKTIAQNVPATVLPDPCSYCAVTGVEVPAKTFVYKEQDQAQTQYKFCMETKASNEFVIVSRNDVNGKILDASRGGDAVMAVVWRSVVTVVGQNKKFHTFYHCYREDQKTAAFDFLFNGSKYVYIKAGADIINGNFLRAFGLEDRSCVYFESWTSGWDSYIVDPELNPDKWIKSRKASNFRYHESEDNCPWAFDVGCGDWDNVQKIKMLTYDGLVNNALIYPNSGSFVDNDEYNAKNGVIGYVGRFDRSTKTVVFKPLIIDNPDAGLFIKNRLMYKGETGFFPSFTMLSEDQYDDGVSKSS